MTANVGVDRARYWARLYAAESRRYACRAQTPEELSVWQAEARPFLRELIGLDSIHRSVYGHECTVDLSEPEVLDGYTRQLGHLHSEPDVSVPFWMLRPDGPGPFPLGIFPHGHEQRGMDTYAGIYHNEEKRRQIEREERDVAVQAVRRGVLAIASTTRGFAPASVPDTTGRHGKQDCRSQLIHCLLAGRTAIGERVWDLSRLLDWASARPDVASDRVLMMGNSGGGMTTLYASACDTRVSVAVPSCSFCTFASEEGYIHHCDCNTVPGILGFGEFHDIAGLIAPRHLLVVNGRADPLFPLAEVDRAVAGCRRIYAVTGVSGRFEHQYGTGGHRFYKDLMWPFIEPALAG